MLLMLPPTIFRTKFILHLCFFFFFNALKKKKHAKGWDYAKPYSHIIVLLIRASISLCHFLLSFSCAMTFQAWDSLWCFGFTGKVLLLLFVTQTSIQNTPPVFTERAGGGEVGGNKKDTFLTGCFVKQELQTLLILCAVHDWAFNVVLKPGYIYAPWNYKIQACRGP